MDIKLIAFDLDGTTLNEKGEWSQVTKDQMAAAVQAGFHLVPSTGRTVVQLPEYIKNMPGIKYAVLSNGTRVVDLEAEQDLHSDMMHKEDLEFLFKLITEGGFLFEVFCQGQVLCDKSFQTLVKESFETNPKADMWIYEQITFVEDLISYIWINDLAVEKMNIHNVEGAARRELDEILAGRDSLYLTTSNAMSIEINNRTANKATGLMALCKILNLSEDNIMAFGDGYNDVEMLDYAGFSVAMANGVPAVHQVASYITLSNAEDGVAKAMGKFLGIGSTN